MRRKTWACFQTPPGRWWSSRWGRPFPRLATSTALTLWVGLLLAAPHTGWAEGLPTFEQVRDRTHSSQVLVVDRHGAPLHRVRVDFTQRRLAWIPLDDIAPTVRQAVVLAEDQRFWRHGGVDGLALGRAAFSYITGGARSGASTLTMQLVALLEPRGRPHLSRRTVTEKLRQMRDAWALESGWSKAQILEAYLNLVTFRGELQGVEATAQGLFGKAPHGLTSGEAVLMAALLRGPRADYDALAARACRLAMRLPDGPGCGAVEAALEALRRGASAAPLEPALAPHAAVRLVPRHAAGNPWPETIPSTLDARVQARVNALAAQQVLALRGRNVQDAAVLVVENISGDVLAYLGSVGSLSSAPAVDGVMALRQAGSTLKPLLYGHAIERRILTAASRMEDEPLELATSGGIYRPRDYDQVWHGTTLTLRVALASSLNVPAVRTLDLLGPDTLVRTLRLLGFPDLREGDHYGPSLALGSADVRLWDLVGAYRMLANGGVATALRLQAEQAAAPPRRVFSQQTAFIVADILADRESRAVTFGLENALAPRFWAAVKTGTSKDMRDNWCIGFSRRYTVGVWMGNFSGDPMWNVSGVTGAAPLWAAVMADLHRDLPSRAPRPPAGLVRAGSPPEWFLAGTEPGAGGFQPATHGDARIRYPVAGTIVAFDPDIPAARQRVFFEAEGLAAGLRWWLDGRPLGATDTEVSWRPDQMGAHLLQLQNPEGTIVDSVRFLVRGAVRKE